MGNSWRRKYAEAKKKFTRENRGRKIVMKKDRDDNSQGSKQFKVGG